MSTGISPPPLKRKRLDISGSEVTTTGSTLTVYTWNVNGITPFIQQSITSFFQSEATRRIGHGERNGCPVSLRNFLKHHAYPDVVFLQEVKINSDDKATIAAMTKAVRRQRDEESNSPSYTVHFCLPSDKYNARGFGRKVYGICSIIRKDFFENAVAAVRPVDWDREGRFQVIETRASSSLPKLAIVNVYAVNGTDNPYKDPHSGEPSGTRHDRKLKVHALLQDECRRLEKNVFGCIVAGDINIARAAMDGYPSLRTFPPQHCSNRADFEARFIQENERKAGDGSDASAGLGMIDTFRHLHPEKRGYTYYPRTRNFGDSCDRVDMILISKDLEPDLKAAGIHETPADRGPSDHVPLYARFDFAKDSTEKRASPTHPQE